MAKVLAERICRGLKFLITVPQFWPIKFNDGSGFKNVHTNLNPIVFVQLHDIDKKLFIKKTIIILMIKSLKKHHLHQSQTSQSHILVKQNLPETGQLVMITDQFQVLIAAEIR